MPSRHIAPTTSHDRIDEALRASASSTACSRMGPGSSYTGLNTRHPALDNVRVIRASRTVRHRTSRGALSSVPQHVLWGSVGADLGILQPPVLPRNRNVPSLRSQFLFAPSGTWSMTTGGAQPAVMLSSRAFLFPRQGKGPDQRGKQ